MEAARHGGQAVHGRIGVEAAEGHGHRRTPSASCSAQIAIHAGRELRRRHRGVAPEAARRADMVVPADDTLAFG